MEDERIAAGLHCGEVQADLTESLDGRLSRERSLRIEEHRLECEPCRRLGDEIAAAVRALRQLPDEPLALEVEARLLSSLLSSSISPGEAPSR